MPQAATLPPPPIEPQGSGLPYFRLAVLAAVAVLALFIIWELRVVNSSAGKEAAQRIRSDARVRTEFGDDVHIPFAWGWMFDGKGQIYAHVSGNRGRGSAIVNMEGYGDTRAIISLEVRNAAEGHLINLAQPSTPATPEQLKAWPLGTLYFVALGELADGDTGELATFFEKDFGIAVKTLPPMSLPSDAYDSRRKQWVAEMLARAIEEKYPEVASDPDAQVVGILEDDTYIRSFNWAFTYSYRENNKYSVVPTARLDPSFGGFPANEAIRMERLRKVAMKAVGLMYLGFAESTDPQSVDAIEASIRDIDRMGSVYLFSDVRTRPSRQDTDGNPCLKFFSANVAGAPLGKPIAPCWQYRDNSETSEFQIQLAQGKFEVTHIDLHRGGPVPLQLVRMSFSTHFDDKVRAFGKSTWQSLDDTVWSSDPNSIQTINVNGVLYNRITPGNGFSPTAKYRAGPNQGLFSRALLSWENNGWRIDTYGGEVWRYLGCGASTRIQCYFMGMTNLAGDGIAVDRDLKTTGHIQKVSQKTSTDFPGAGEHDHTWTPVYDGDKITEIHDSDGGTAHYAYDPDEYLTDVNADGHHVHYDYDRSHRITGIVEDGHGVQIHYDAEGRADRVDLPAGSMNLHYSGDVIDVEANGRKYKVTIMPNYYRVVEDPASIQ